MEKLPLNILDYSAAACFNKRVAMYKSEVRYLEW